MKESLQDLLAVFGFPRHNTFSTSDESSYLGKNTTFLPEFITIDMILFWIFILLMYYNLFTEFMF
jgi:hypothetical protein